MQPLDPHATRRVVLGIAAVVALLAGGLAYLLSFPDPDRPAPVPPPAVEPSGFADEPTPEELAEADIPVPVGGEGSWPAGLDCVEYGELVVARDRYGDVQARGGRTRRRPSASLDLGEVHLARTVDGLCVAWLARRPPRVPLVIDLEVRESPNGQRAWAVRVTLEPDRRRSVAVAAPGEELAGVPARLDVSRRYGRILLGRDALPPELPVHGFQWQVVSRSPLLTGGREFIDCVPDAVRVIYPAATGEELPQDAPCLETARAQP